MERKIYSVIRIVTGWTRYQTTSENYPMGTDRSKREFAVIFHADVAGYSELMERDEDLTHQLVTVCFDRLEDSVQRFSGSVCEKRGDALLARFEQPSDGLGAAMMYQLDAKAQASRRDDDICPELRIGINLAARGRPTNLRSL